MQKKRRDECLCCSSRTCYERVVSTDVMIDTCLPYDEVACRLHIKDLHRDSDEKAPRIMKQFISSTGRQKRGEPLVVTGILRQTHANSSRFLEYKTKHRPTPKEPKVEIQIDESVTEEQLEGVCRDLKELTALKGVPPEDAVLYVIKASGEREWHIAFDYHLMGRWVLISTTGKLIERSNVEFSQTCDSLRDEA